MNAKARANWEIGHKNSMRINQHLKDIDAQNAWNKRAIASHTDLEARVNADEDDFDDLQKDYDDYTKDTDDTLDSHVKAF